MEGALAVLAEPHTGYPVVHVAGTNGKTSVVWLASAILSAHGLNVGSYVSPHLEAVEQRYALSSVDLSRERFAALVAETAPLIELFEKDSVDRLTYFETTTVLAFALFAGAAVDAAVVEVGLGGRLDATNVVNADVSVITSIGVDHTEYLGDEVADIAAEKAAIVKDGGTLVTGELPAEAQRAVAARVADTGATRRSLGDEFRIEKAATAVGGWLIDIDGVYDTYQDVHFHGRGRHQVDNLAVAVAACESLLGRALSVDATREAAASVALPGRLEVVSRAPLTILDGAHNPAGFEALNAAIRHEFPTHSWVLVIGAMDDKPLDQMVDPLSGVVDQVVAAAPDAERSRPAEEVARIAGDRLGVPSQAAGTVAAAVEQAGELAGKGGSVLVTGSLYVVGEARAAYLSRAEMEE